MSQLLSVTSLNTKIKSLLEATFMHTLVEGEVASVTYHTSGHLYFSIKDADSSIKCIMWRSSVAKMKIRIETGMQIVVEGSIGVYTPRGEYQFYAVSIEPYGQGALALAYEQLKKRLQERGYFDPLRKKPIPKVIQKIVLVTAKESAALYDMLKVIDKRWPLLEVVVVDTLVQGEQASYEIAHALRVADGLCADVVVVGRGGGSAEDLWAFNEERVADAIFGIQTPIVSAVGHEVDTLISDFVADLRAPTPSAAIEMVLPDKNEIRYALLELMERFGQAMRLSLEKKEKQLSYLYQIHRQLSPLRQLTLKESDSVRLQDEMVRAYLYSLQIKEEMVALMYEKLHQTIHFLIRHQSETLQMFDKTTLLQNPDNRVNEGWGQISQNGIVVSLESIQEDELFSLQNTHLRVTARCIERVVVASKEA